MLDVIGFVLGLLFFAALAILAAYAYFLPAISARGKRNFKAICILNLLLGWTLIGWVVALVWAHTSDAGLTA